MRNRLIAVALMASPLAHADAPQSARADGHAPIGVMADHLHRGGDWMVGYRFMRTLQDELRDGTDHVGKRSAYSSVAAGLCRQIGWHTQCWTDISYRRYPLRR